MNLKRGSCGTSKRNTKPLTTLMPKLTCKAIKRALGSCTSVKENIILEISDQDNWKSYKFLIHIWNCNYFKGSTQKPPKKLYYLTTVSLLTSMEEHLFRRQETEFKSYLILNGSSRHLGGLNQSPPTVEMLSSHHMKLNHTDIHTFLFYIQQPSTYLSSSLISRTANAVRWALHIIVTLTCWKPQNPYAFQTFYHYPREVKLFPHTLVSKCREEIQIASDHSCKAQTELSSFPQHSISEFLITQQC